jgi:hypothetical protein
VNFQYDLPWRPGGRALRAVTGGWGLNGIITVQGGMPIPIDEEANTTDSFGGLQRPNSTGISSLTPGSPSRSGRWMVQQGCLRQRRTVLLRQCWTHAAR